jgi:hypothetical protein
VAVVDHLNGSPPDAYRVMGWRDAAVAARTFWQPPDMSESMKPEDSDLAGLCPKQEDSGRAGSVQVSTGRLPASHPKQLMVTGDLVLPNTLADGGVGIFAITGCGRGL